MYQSAIPSVQHLQSNPPIEPQRPIQYHVIHPDKSKIPQKNPDAPVVTKRKVGRPKANLKRKLFEEAEARKAIAENEAFLAQTRCGRKVKLPKKQGAANYFQVIFWCLNRKWFSELIIFPG